MMSTTDDMMRDLAQISHGDLSVARHARDTAALAAAHTTAMLDLRAAARRVQWGRLGETARAFLREAEASEHHGYIAVLSDEEAVAIECVASGIAQWADWQLDPPEHTMLSMTLGDVAIAESEVSLAERQRAIARLLGVECYVEVADEHVLIGNDKPLWEAEILYVTPVRVTYASEQSAQDELAVIVYKNVAEIRALAWGSE